MLSPCQQSAFPGGMERGGCSNGYTLGSFPECPFADALVRPVFLAGTVISLYEPSCRRQVSLDFLPPSGMAIGRDNRERQTLCVFADAFCFFFFCFPPSLPIALLSRLPPMLNAWVPSFLFLAACLVELYDNPVF